MCGEEGRGTWEARGAWEARGGLGNVRKVPFPKGRGDSWWSHFGDMNIPLKSDARLCLVYLGFSSPRPTGLVHMNLDPELWGSPRPITHVC